MSRTSLQRIADAVRRRAQRDGFVVASQVRAELTEAGLADSQWKNVVKLIGSSLSYRNGRYYYVPSGPSRMRVRVRQDQRRNRAIDRVVRRLIREQRQAEAVMIERRASKRISFVQPIEVRTADGRCLRWVTREVSVSGIRLIGNENLQGQKIQIWVPRPDKTEETYGFVVQVLWGCEVGDGLYENGGVFLEMAPGTNPLKIARLD
jgi:hypothetical protein